MKQSVKSNSLVKFEGLSTFLTQTVGRFDMWVDPIIILWKFSNELLRHESGSSGFLSTVFRGTTSFLCMFFIILCHFCNFFGFIIQDLETPKPDFFLWVSDCAMLMVWKLFCLYNRFLEVGWVLTEISARSKRNNFLKTVHLKFGAQWFKNRFKLMGH